MSKQQKRPQTPKELLKLRVKDILFDLGVMLLQTNDRLKEIETQIKTLKNDTKQE